MNGEDMDKVGIENLLDDGSILVILEREKMRKIFEREITGLKNEVSGFKNEVTDLKNEVDEYRNLQKRAGQAAAAKFDNLREFCIEIYTDQCLSVLTQKQLISSLSSGSEDDREKIFKKVRPVFKVFAEAYHKLAAKKDWSDEERYWLGTAAAAAKTDATLHKWWKGLNKALKEMLIAGPNVKLED
jgi:hypothetical protein